MAIRQSSSTRARSSNRPGRRSPLWTVAAAMLLAFVPTAGAIDIVIQLGDADENPIYDPDGSRLVAMFNAAAAIWEDYLPASGTYEVDIFWSQSEFDDDPDTLARWYFDGVGDNNIYVRPYPINANWYIDATPLDHSEYDFDTINTGTDTSGGRTFRGGNYLYRDLLSGEQANWFNGSPPPLLEVGYRGRAATGTGSLINQLDLLSTVIHELGHELGVNGSGGPWIANSAFMPEGSVTFEENSEGGHLRARSTLMCGGCGLVGTRRLPSAADIMAVADDEDFDLIDLPRQDFVGNGSWGDATRWFGGALPDADDYAFLRNGAVVGLDANRHVEGLVVAEDALLHAPFKLTVDEGVTVLGPSNSNLLIALGGELETPALTVTDGVVSVASGVLDINGPFTIGTSGLLRGRGTVEMEGPLVNNGQIAVDIPGTLTLSPSFFGGGSIDLDGATENGFVLLSEGDLVVGGLGGLTDAFDGSLFIDNGHSFSSSAAWTLGTDGTLILRNDGLLPGAVEGALVTVNGSVLVSTNQFGAFYAPQSFGQTADVHVADDGVLWLNGTTTFRGGSYRGDGMLVQNGNATVTLDTQIDTARYDMDGFESVPATLTVNQGTQLLVNSMRIDSVDADGFDGTIHLNGGTLDVQTHDLFFINDLPVRRGIPWEMEGTLNMTPIVFATAEVKGSRMIVGNPANPFGQIGRINASDGWSRLFAPVTFEQTAQVVLTEDARLSLESTGPTIYRGGSFTGPGELEQTSDAIVEGNTHIQVQNYDMDGANENAVITVNRQVVFDVNTFQIEDSGGGAAFDGTAIVNGGQLIVRPHRLVGIVGGPPQRQEFAWNMRGQLELHADGTAAALGGNRMNVGEPNTGEPPARVVVGPGRTNITAAEVVFEPRSVLEIQIGGLEFTEFGRFHMLNRLTLDGILDVNLINGFLPDVGDRFIVASGLAGVLGTFDAAELPGGEWGLTYLFDSVVLEFLSDAGTADFDGDGDVDGADFLVWQSHFGITQGATRGEGDSDGDGDVDGNDFLAWQTQFASGEGGGSLSVIPEPCALGLLLIAAGVIAPRRRARCRAVAAPSFAGRC